MYAHYYLSREDSAPRFYACLLLFMGSMLGVVLALGLTGCSWQDDVKVRGEGAVVEQQHPLGREVTRVLAGVPANL